jgi:hypothetical protein
MNKYATVTEDDGDNYREIAEIMTELGFKMNHSTARNYVVKAMKMFALELYKNCFSIDLNEERLTEIAKDPSFQAAVCDILHSIETKNKKI